jgi:hypothetical protein
VARSSFASANMRSASSAISPTSCGRIAGRGEFVLSPIEESASGAALSGCHCVRNRQCYQCHQKTQIHIVILNGRSAENRGEGAAKCGRVKRRASHVIRPRPDPSARSSAFK